MTVKFDTDRIVDDDGMEMEGQNDKSCGEGRDDGNHQWGGWMTRRVRYRACCVCVCLSRSKDAKRRTEGSWSYSTYLAGL